MTTEIRFKGEDASAHSFDPDGVVMDGPPNTMFKRVRYEVAEFAAAMEQKLRKNDHKTGWKDQPIEAHIRLLMLEIEEFKVALEFFGDAEAANECVDIANFSLIIRDKLLRRIAAKHVCDAEDGRNCTICGKLEIDWGHTK